MTLAIYPTLPGLTFTSLKTPEFNTDVESADNFYEVRISQTINPRWNFTLIYDFLHDFPWGQNVGVSELRVLMGFFLQMSGKAGSFLFTDPDDNYVGPHLSQAAWQPYTYYNIGQGILDPSYHWQQVTTPGFSSNPNHPTWNDSGGTTNDNQVVWQDNGVFSSAGFPNSPLALLPLVNDGAGNYYSPVQRTLDGFFYEDIIDLVPYAQGGNTINVCANGVPVTNYTLLGPGLALPNASYMGMYLQWASAPTPPITAEFNFFFRVRFDSDSQDFEKFLAIGSAAVQAGQGGGYWTIGGSEAQNGTGTLKLTSARPTPL